MTVLAALCSKKVNKEFGYDWKPLRAIGCNPIAPHELEFFSVR